MFLKYISNIKILFMYKYIIINVIQTQTTLCTNNLKVCYIYLGKLYLKKVEANSNHCTDTVCFNAYHNIYRK